MLNALIQLGTLVFGVMINFVAPMAYGLEQYGSFVAQNAWVLLLYRVMFIIGEPLIRFEQARRILASSLVLNGLVLVVFLLVSSRFMIGSPLLLAGYLMSASAMLAMQAMQQRALYVAFIFAESLCFLVAVLLSPDSMPLLRVMELSVSLPSFVCVCLLFLRGAIVPTPRALLFTLRETLITLPRIIGITLVMNLLMSALPVFLAPRLSARDMGLFKIMVSVIQSAMSLFPASTQALLTSFVNHPRGPEFYRLLTSVAMLYFSVALLAITLLAMLFPPISPYVMLIAVAPVFYHAVLTERHLTALHHVGALLRINLALGLAIMVSLQWVSSVAQAALLYATGFTLYALFLSLAERRHNRDLQQLCLMVACPLVVVLMMSQLWVGTAYALLIIAFTCFRHVPTREELLLLWREL